MRRVTGFRVGLLAASVTSISLVAIAGQPAGPKPRITVSKETTFILGPLDQEGYVDYFAALNAAMAKGVTPQNNAAVLLYRAVGPKEVPKEGRAEVARKLGIDPLPEGGTYFEKWEAFVRRTASKEAGKHSAEGNHDPVKAAEAQYDRARERPWSSDECPLVAKWLADNERPLELAVAATKRPRFYFPLYRSHPSDMLLEAPLTYAQQSREVVRALQARAMLYLHSSKVDEAWQDILACHRLARLIGRQSTFVEGLVCYAIDRTTCSCDAALAHYGGLSADKARQLLDDFRHLPPLPKIGEKIVIGERYEDLDAAATAARRGPLGVLRTISYLPAKKGWGISIAETVSILLVDWNEPMRMGNAWYDRFADAFAQPTRSDRNDALVRIDRDLQQTKKDAKDKSLLMGETYYSLSRALGRKLGRIFVTKTLPALFAAIYVEDCTETMASMSQVALALAAYRAEHGTYPADLGQLCPKHLAAIPGDPFSGGPLRYQRGQTGYVIYSVGHNGKDDGGMSRSGGVGFSDAGDADDIAIRMPPAGK
jgi:hypothetical protein